MGPLFAYSLVPVVAVSALLFFTAVLRGRNALGLAMYCLAIGCWSGALLMIAVPSTADFGERVAAIGAFTAPGFLHAAYDLTGKKRRGLLWVAYAAALGVALVGGIWRGSLYGPRAMTSGPLFWPAMALATGAACLPLYTLYASTRSADGEHRRDLVSLMVAGTLTYVGAMSTALLLSHGLPLPIGLYLALAGLLVLANVIRARQARQEQRLLERSLLYSGLTALLSAGFLFGVMSLMSASSQPFLISYRLGALFLMFMAALAFEPVRQGIQEQMGRLLLRDRPRLSDLARELEVQERKADHAERLAELGSVVSAVAHEVRNPLGVLSANLKLLERRGASAETQAMRDQIDRASHFVDELLRYGRPRPLDLRLVQVRATLELAVSTARQGLGALAPPAEVEVVTSGAPELVEADQAQLLQMLVILLENALQALPPSGGRVRVSASADGGGEAVRLAVEDSGVGVPPELLPRLFQPFVTGRSREGPRPGTGLGLAIARGIAERHRGSISAGSSALGGARFEVRLPRAQPVLAMATAQETA